MIQRRWFAVSVMAVFSMTHIANPRAEGQSAAKATEVHTWTADERAEWLTYAQATWRSIAAMAERDRLPADRLERDPQGNWKASQRTSPTDIASYLWSVLAARELDLIDEAETDRRLATTLGTLSAAARDHGFFFNLYEVATANPVGVDGTETRPARAFLSSVDNAWLAAALMMVGNARPTLRQQAEALWKPMDFGFFYVPFDPADPIHKPGLFHGGYYPEDRSFTTFYGMLNTEPRLIGYLAIARGQVPPEHYYRLFRTYPVDRDRQSQVPQGEVRSYQNVSVFEGHYRYRDLDLVPSWGGSMFEALMVPLFIPEERWAPQSWGVNHPLYVRAQIEEGLIVRRYGFWGFSPSWTPEGGYQTYGVSEIGTEVDGYRTYENPQETKPKRGKPTGGCFEGVVTPHASFLALRYAPRETLDNLRALKKAFPIYTETVGFHDSVNLKTGAVSHCVLSLDQGMILAAIANTLKDDAMRRMLCQGPFEATICPLIAPEQFTAGDRRP